MTTAKNDIAGWVIKIVTTQMSGGEPMAAYYAVAMKMPGDAEKAAAARDGATPDEKVEACDRLSSSEIDALGLKVGEVRVYPHR